MKLSIIVPVYKVEPYLCRCVDSILAQTFRDFEVILVDDGSPDNCGAICDEYAAKDERVKVIHKANGGVSSARNIGIENAQGDLIVFCDSDDYVNACYLENLLSVQKAGEYVFTVSDWTPFTEAGENKPSSMLSERIVELDKLDGSEFSYFFLNFRLWSPYCKLYSREIINKCGIRFDTRLKSAEDFAFNMEYLRSVDRFAYIPMFDYHYRVEWKPLKLGVVTESSVLSLHIIAEKLTWAAERGSVLLEVQDKIAILVAEKMYYGRLPGVYVKDSSVSRKVRKELFELLMNGSNICAELCELGAPRLQMNPIMRRIVNSRQYIVWKMFYMAVNISNAIKKKRVVSNP